MLLLFFVQELKRAGEPSTHETFWHANAKREGCKPLSRDARPENPVENSHPQTYTQFLGNFVYGGSACVLQGRAERFCMQTYVTIRGRLRAHAGGALAAPIGKARLVTAQRPVTAG